MRVFVRGINLSAIKAGKDAGALISRAGEEGRVCRGLTWCGHEGINGGSSWAEGWLMDGRRLADGWKQLSGDLPTDDRRLVDGYPMLAHRRQTAGKRLADGWFNVGRQLVDGWQTVGWYSWCIVNKLFTDDRRTQFYDWHVGIVPTHWNLVEVIRASSTPRWGKK